MRLLRKVCLNTTQNLVLDSSCQKSSVQGRHGTVIWTTNYMYIRALDITEWQQSLKILNFNLMNAFFCFHSFQVKSIRCPFKIIPAEEKGICHFTVSLQICIQASPSACRQFQGRNTDPLSTGLRTVGLSVGMDRYSGWWFKRDSACPVDAPSLFLLPKWESERAFTPTISSKMKFQKRVNICS